MDKITLAFIVLVAVLFFAQYAVEGFVDASGGYVTISLIDLLSLFREVPIAKKAKDTSKEEEEPSTLDQQFVTDLRKDVRESVRSELQKQGTKNPVLTDSCIDSVANQQGSDWMRYIPGKNPADYIRKDSIPCYGCSLTN